MLSRTVGFPEESQRAVESAFHVSPSTYCRTTHHPKTRLNTLRLSLADKRRTVFGTMMIDS